MAEGFAKQYLNQYKIYSAGTHPETINPMAIKVMREINIDISDQVSNSISEENINSYDWVITLCGNAKDQCINLNELAENHMHWDLKDPAKSSGTPDEIKAVYCDIRNQILERVKKLSLKISTVVSI